jgi:hypothetical protein
MVKRSQWKSREEEDSVLQLLANIWVDRDKVKEVPMEEEEEAMGGVLIMVEVVVTVVDPDTEEVMEGLVLRVAIQEVAMDPPRMPMQWAMVEVRDLITLMRDAGPLLPTEIEIAPIIVAEIAIVEDLLLMIARVIEDAIGTEIMIDRVGEDQDLPDIDRYSAFKALLTYICILFPHL